MKRMHEPVYAARLVHLLNALLPHLRAGDRVLDVGCGFGGLGRALMDDKRCPADVVVTGLERYPREGAMIDITGYDGVKAPFDDNSFDMVIVADVLHHEEQPDHLLAECARLSRRYVVIKDHQRQGLLAQARISLIDWAANAPYGVKCLYRYPTTQGWRESHAKHNLAIVEERAGMTLYPQPYELLFGGSLQYFAVLQVSDGAADAPGAPPASPEANG